MSKMKLFMIPNLSHGIQDDISAANTVIYVIIQLIILENLMSIVPTVLKHLYG